MAKIKRWNAHDAPYAVEEARNLFDHRTTYYAICTASGSDVILSRSAKSRNAAEEVCNKHVRDLAREAARNGRAKARKS